MIPPLWHSNSIWSSPSSREQTPISQRPPRVSVDVPCALERLPPPAQLSKAPASAPTDRDYKEIHYANKIAMEQGKVIGKRQCRGTHCLCPKTLVALEINEDVMALSIPYRWTSSFVIIGMDTPSWCRSSSVPWRFLSVWIWRLVADPSPYVY